MIKTIAVIPARGNSKRLPKKNIKELGGIPLLGYSINYARRHEFIDEIYVSTDDEEIKNVALNFKAKVINRPDNLSGDYATTVSALKHVLQEIEIDNVENVVLLQPTNPLRPKLLLEEAYRKYKEEKLDSLFTVTRNVQKFGMIKDHKYKPYNYSFGQRSQDLEPLYYENGLLYITKSKLILKDTIISKEAFPFVVNHPFASIDIDDQEDFDLAQFYLEKYKNE